jgi:sigma-B regulation protein RsbU (phosphoserine phosphatase)
VRLRTQLAVAFLLLAVLPPAAMTLYSYASSQDAYRQAVAAEARRLAGEMSSRLGQAVAEVSSRIGRMRERSRTAVSSAFEKARLEALAAAEPAELRPLLAAILSGAGREEGSLPFALDTDGKLQVAEAADEATLASLGLRAAGDAVESGAAGRGDWVVVSQMDAASGITVGVARPVASALRQFRATALRNLAYGLALVVLALLGILPLSRRLTRHLDALTAAAERLGGGERAVQVNVPRGAELGRLATAFNRMSHDLAEHQARLLAEERLRKELEISRRIQEELLPREPARLPFVEVAGTWVPAREVGGDFFNYFPLPGDEAAVLVGDVSGKGVPAAILMANLQATLRARMSLERDLARLAEAIDVELGAPDAAEAYVTLFVAILDGRDGWLRYVNAGHGTQLLLRRTGAIERLESTGRPPGLLPGGGYQECRLPVGPGDSLLLFTDGLLDAESEAGEPFGMERLERIVAGGDGAAMDLLARVGQALTSHLGRAEAADDATIVALHVSAAAAPSGL